MNRLLTVYQASRTLNVTAPTVYEWIRRGILSGHKDMVTGQLFVDPAEVESLAPARRIKPLAGGENANGTESQARRGSTRLS